MKNNKIVILGAGVSGLTTAIALHQKGFHNITFYRNYLGIGIQKLIILSNAEFNP